MRLFFASAAALALLTACDDPPATRARAAEVSRAPPATRAEQVQRIQEMNAIDARRVRQ